MNARNVIDLAAGKQRRAARTLGLDYEHMAQLSYGE